MAVTSSLTGERMKRPPSWLVSGGVLQRQSHLCLVRFTAVGCPVCQSAFHAPCGARVSPSRCKAGRLPYGATSFHAATAVALATAAASTGVLAAGCAAIFGGIPVVNGVTAFGGCDATNRAFCVSARALAGHLKSIATSLPSCGEPQILRATMCAVRTASFRVRHDGPTYFRTRQQPSRSGLPPGSPGWMPAAFLSAIRSGYCSSKRGSCADGSITSACRSGNTAGNGSVSNSVGINKVCRRFITSYSRSRRKYFGGECRCSKYCNSPTTRSDSSCRHVASRQHTSFHHDHSRSGESSPTEADDRWRRRAHEGQKRANSGSSRSSGTEDEDSSQSKSACARAVAGTPCFAPVFLHDGEPEESDVVNKQGLRLHTYVWKPCNCNVSVQQLRKQQRASNADNVENEGAAPAPTAAATLTFATPTTTGGTTAPPYVQEQRETEKQKGATPLGWTGELVEDSSVPNVAPVIRCSRCEGRVRGVVLLVHGFGEHCRGQFLAKPLEQLDPVCRFRKSSTRSWCSINSRSDKSTLSVRPVNSSGETAAADSSADSDSVAHSPASHRLNEPVKSSSSSTSATDKDSGRCNSARIRVRQPKNEVEERPLINTQLRYIGSWIQRLNNEGYIVVGYDSQGHGISEGWHGHRCCVEDLDDYARDVLLLLQLTQLRFTRPATPEITTSSQIPLYVISVSMGAWATARALQLAAEPRERQALLPAIEAAAAASQTGSPASRVFSIPAVVPRAPAKIANAPTETTGAAGEPLRRGTSASTEAPDVATSAEGDELPQAATGVSPTAAMTTNTGTIADPQDNGVLCSLVGSRLSHWHAPGACGRIAASRRYPRMQRKIQDGAETILFGQDELSSSETSSFLAPIRHSHGVSQRMQQTASNSTCVMQNSDSCGISGAVGASSVISSGHSWTFWNSSNRGATSECRCGSNSYDSHNEASTTAHSISSSITCRTPCASGSTTAGEGNSSQGDGAVDDGNGAKNTLAALAHASLDLKGVVLLSPMFDTERRRRELKWDILRLALSPLAYFFPSLSFSPDLLRFPHRIFRTRTPVTAVEPSFCMQRQESGDVSRCEMKYKVNVAGDLPPASPSATRKSARLALLARLHSKWSSLTSECTGCDSHLHQHRDATQQQGNDSSNVTQQRCSKSFQQQASSDMQEDGSSSNQRSKSTSSTKTRGTNSAQRLRDVYLRDPLTYKLPPPGNLVAAVMRSADSVLLPEQMNKITKKTTQGILVIHSAEDPVCDYRGAFLFCQGLLQSAVDNSSPHTLTAEPPERAVPAGGAACAPAAIPGSVTHDGALGGERPSGEAPLPLDDEAARQVNWKLILLNARTALEKARRREQSLPQAVEGAQQAPAAAVTAAAADARARTARTSTQEEGITAETLSFSEAAAALSACPQSFLWADKKGSWLLSALLEQHQKPHEQQLAQALQQGELHRHVNKRLDLKMHPCMPPTTRIMSIGASSSWKEGRAEGKHTNSTAEQPVFVSRRGDGHSTSQQLATHRQQMGSTNRQLQLVDGIGEVFHNLPNEPGGGDVFAIVKDWMHAPRERSGAEPSNHGRSQ